VAAHDVTPRSSFDAAYYQRFYRNPRTRVTDRKSCRELANLVFAYLDHMRIPVRRVLDIGCGTGLWRQEVRRKYPAAQYVGVDWSDYACAEYGWEKGSVVDYRPAVRSELVICQGVLQYLRRQEAEAAIANLPRLTRAVVYLEILTKEDWEHNCNRELTDARVHLRSVSWYRRRLREDFLYLGGGLFLLRGTPAVLYELEYLG
jgi:trans-aconitate methyltransferase